MESFNKRKFYVNFEKLYAVSFGTVYIFPTEFFPVEVFVHEIFCLFTSPYSYFKSCSKVSAWKFSLQMNRYCGLKASQTYSRKNFRSSLPRKSKVLNVTSKFSDRSQTGNLGRHLLPQIKTILIDKIMFFHSTQQQI
jgi:hypothetical protein